MLPSPGLGDQTAFVEELPDVDDVEAEDILGHTHPVDFDVRGEVIPPFDGVSMDGPVMGDYDGHKNRLCDLLLPGFPCGPRSVLLSSFSEGLVHFIC